jgi:hypothetical protein
VAFVVALGALPVASSAAPLDVSPARSVMGPVVPAAVADNFDPGDIISDSVFFDPGTMTREQVQRFLDDQGERCVPGLPGEPACLKDIQVTTVAKAADALCSGYAGDQVQSAAQIIVGVALSCGINPRVLLVLLEKEQSLITRSRPTTYAYERATGYGCPDTAPCNTEYFGLFNQLYLAARRFQEYAAYPDRFPRYRPGRVNTILYHPNAACGAGDVYIRNQATAGLYTYTPYQPNAAALANLYGVGDSCSAYGNRNFWRMFSDWFGDPRAGSFLVRTPDDPTVYLVAGVSKHPVPSLALVDAYAPLGSVGLVSQLYLDRLVTGPTLGRFILGSDGSVYLVDRGTRHHFSSCGLVADYGGSCGALISLPDVQVGALAAGPPMTSVTRTTSGKTFYVAAGVRREVADEASLVAAGVPTATVPLSDDAIGTLPYGDPVIRDAVVLQARGSGALLLSSSAGVHSLPAALAQSTALGALPVRPMDPPSLARLSAGPSLGPFVRDASDDRALLLHGTSSTPVTDPAALPQAMVSVGPEVLAGFTGTGPAPRPLFVKPADSITVYLVSAGAKLPVRNLTELAVLAGTPAPPILTIPGGVAGLLPTGRDAGLTQFDDVRITAEFAADIVWLADSGITSGYPDQTFRPTSPVSREAMAAFLYRQSGSPAFTPPAAPTFVDVVPGSTFFREIEWLAAQGISEGTRLPDGSRRFEPGTPVSRQAMAAFLHRHAGSPPVTVPSTPTFADVPRGASFAAEIEWLYGAGVTTGTPQGGALLYRPADAVSRQAMAAFLHRYSEL